MNDTQREFLERVANSDHLIALGKVGSNSVAAALSDLAAKDRRIAELEAEIAGHPRAIAAAELKGWQHCIDAVRGSVEGYPNQGGDTVIMAAIDNLIAAAKREALEDAARHYEVEGWMPYIGTQVAEFLRRMAREVKP